MKARHISQTGLAVLALTLLSAHVAPSVDDNNRYLKLTPLGDRVRIAYTVFFGEIPGAQERRGIDANRDGQISQAEANSFGQRLADQVAANVELEIDGTRTPLSWQTIDVGMGTPEVAAGAFSVDLVAYPCLAKVRGRHRLVLRDHLRLTNPGETEVKVEDSPGVTIDHARIGAADDPSYDYKFVGALGPISDDGLDLQYNAGPKAPVTADGTCKAASSGGGSALPWLAGAGALVVVAGLLAFVLVRRRRAQT
ncbi:MAG TPA: hypothetical protein VLT45_02890 [Kofleriaceae bacterium]|nr:hypothetical protein [Kofleriaceae bacterium]